MVARYGERGVYISQIQKYLSNLGYDLVVDGHFGKVTLRSVKAFQKRIGLNVDGEVGERTYTALKVSQKRSFKESSDRVLEKDYGELEVNTSCELPSEQYNKLITSKEMVFLHFTAGSGSASNTINYWDSNESKIATAYVIARDNAEIYQAFHPDYWGWHLGVKNTKGRLDKASVGIEVCSYGGLKYKNDSYYAWPDDFSQKTIPAEDVYEVDENFRGYNYFQKFTKEQIDLIEKLLLQLVKEYNISVQDSFDESWFEYKPELVAANIPGIWNHVNVRKDKSDLYPDKRIVAMLNRVSKKVNG